MIARPVCGSNQFERASVSGEPSKPNAGYWPNSSPEQIRQLIQMVRIVEIQGQLLPFSAAQIPIAFQREPIAEPKMLTESTTYY